ncbi:MULTISPECIES: metal ABC transporter permease [Staphylococcus]|uniref:Manganese transport system membrane protein MntC n=1 Tax=Staphylococcus schweitzeri TaxID=1654388 RepID=A0A2K4AEP1_9STAP|nr:MULTISPECIES: metal ABC transporter permease [Staphylococcus]MBE5662027.1 metal ABC transporter permease [Staphylococcus singaporensis]MBO0928349.1 metal ABC transporter permease [Staphylococcus sp. 30403_3112M30944]MBO0945484.1 metal ABC transporter permease [Staphylococcus sp. 30402_3112M30943]MBO0963766.1 metal ABC transporter permease [Staphylococcus sp. 30400_3112M30941]MBO0967545.1 metal ABC transporter permease [Staphylococcus sp. 30401_3112M30942]MCS5349914.1 metal ABC transporter 
MLEFVEHLFTYQFLNRALITSIIVGIVCGTVGSLIVLRGLSLMGDAMSHAVLPGVALSFLFGIPMFVGALVTGMIASIFIGYITSSSKTKPDAAIGISFTAFLASGIIIISLINTTTDLYHILFGNLLAITNSAFLTTIVIGSIVLILIIIFYRPLMISTFDPTFSRMSGLNTTLLHYFVMLLLSLVTVASIQTVGIILVVALLITPASTAFLISKKLYSMMIIASLISVISSIVGLYYSYIYNIPSGATIVLCTFVIYIITLFFTKFTNRKKRGSLT